MLHILIEADKQQSSLNPNPNPKISKLIKSSSKSHKMETLQRIGNMRLSQLPGHILTNWQHTPQFIRSVRSVLNERYFQRKNNFKVLLFNVIGVILVNKWMISHKGFFFGFFLGLCCGRFILKLFCDISPLRGFETG